MKPWNDLSNRVRHENKKIVKHVVPVVWWILFFISCFQGSTRSQRAIGGQIHEIRDVGDGEALERPVGEAELVDEVRWALAVEKFVSP